MNPFDFDFAVVGSGFGGSVAALRLSEKGYRVAVLERGKRWGHMIPGLMEHRTSLHWSVLWNWLSALVRQQSLLCE